MLASTEKEIMANWAKPDQMMVSITCVAFNHEYCIEQALDSFLMQETDFAFEILINDDVSTDKTVDILKAYEKKYPNIVKPVYQQQNQFSQGINTMAILFPKTQGKYVAYCDGDDYWIDKEKLKIQVAQMEKKPELDMSFHSDYELVNDARGRSTSRHATEDKVFTAQEIILGGGDFCPTASLMLRNDLITNFPTWMERAIPGDYVAQMLGSARGGALYIDRCMSIYRVGVASSWSCNELAEDSEKRKQALIAFNDKLALVNHTNHQKFQTEMDQVVREEVLDFIKTRSIQVSVREDIFKKYQSAFNTQDKFAWFLFYRNQNLLNFLNLFKRVVKKIKPKMA